MRIAFLLLIIVLFFTSRSLAQKDNTSEQPSPISSNESITIHNFTSLAPLLYTDSDTIYIVNFWAMWCIPCVKELPIFQEFVQNNPNVVLLLVSLDFPEDIETKLKPFLKKKDITARVVLLDDPDANTWIDKIDPNWSGAIPFTIIFNNKNRTYHERAFSDIKDLQNEIYKTIKNK